MYCSTIWGKYFLNLQPVGQFSPYFIATYNFHILLPLFGFLSGAMLNLTFIQLHQDDKCLTLFEASLNKTLYIPYFNTASHRYTWKSNFNYIY